MAGMPSPLAVHILSLVLLSFGWSQAYNNSTPTVDNEKKRPVIYAFYQRIDPDLRLTGMSDRDDALLLEYWSESWYKAGWEPRILSIYDTAKLHTNYAEFNKQLSAVRLDEFNKLMFLRWLAMAAMGGGWMTDYDVFALRKIETLAELPQNGQMVVYDKRLLPQLVSGSAESYYQTAMALLESAKQHVTTNANKETFYTDSLALLQVSRENKVRIHKRDLVMFGQRALSQDGLLAPEDCNRSRFLKNKMAIHFGCDALLEGKHVEPHLRLPHHRLTVAKQWLESYFEVCPWTSIQKSVLS